MGTEQNGGTQQPRAKQSPRTPAPLPKAPQCEEVAQRLLRNSTLVPVKRFDSADYFLSLHVEQQRLAREEDERLSRSHQSQPQQLQTPLPIEERTQPPPPLSVRHRQQGSWSLSSGGAAG
jgi:hypothetical protein